MQSLWFLCLWSVHLCSGPEEERGVVFNRLKTILLAERYAPVQFIVPFPAYESNITLRLNHAAEALEGLWNLPTYDCDLLQLETLQDNHTSVLINEAFSENALAIAEVDALHLEAGLLLPSRATDSSDQPRHKRFVAVAAGIAVAGVLGLGLGAMLRHKCFLHGVLGTCPDKKIQANSEGIRRTMNEMNLQRQHWLELQNDLNDRFYVIGDTVTQLQDMQRQITHSQAEFWNQTNLAIRVLQNNTRTMRMCEVYLFTRTQANHIRATILSEVDSLIALIRSFRTALTAYRINLLNSLSHLSFGRLPMSLVDRKVLGDILMEVATAQLRAPDRLTLAVPIDDLLAYYEMNLVEQVYTTDSGLFIKFMVPLTSRELVLDVFEAIALPMPGNDSVSYTLWQFDHPYLAISTTHKEHAVLSLEQLQRCLGTRQLAICHQGFPVYRNRDSCLASLFYADTALALAQCSLTTRSYPSSPVAQNLGFGRWLLTSPDDSVLQLYNNTGNTNDVATIPGCRACILTLACGTEIATASLSLRADISSCAHTGARRLQLTLPTPLQHLFQALPNVSEFQSIPDLREAKHLLLREVQLHASAVKHADLNPETLRRLGRPLADRFLRRTSVLTPATVEPFSIWTASLIVGLSGFAISLTLLSLVGGHLYWSILRLADALPEMPEDPDADAKRAAPELDQRRPPRPSYAALRLLLHNPPPPFAQDVQLDAKTLQHPSAPAI